MKQTKLILVGGFLGTGKTTLLRAAARELTQQGHRIALITNDQAPGLVDTAILQQAGWNVGEISGGCFCCKFDDLIRTANHLIAGSNSEIIMGEAVGSCTDLSATVLQPIKDKLLGQFELAPFTVLIDPAHLRDVLGWEPMSKLHASARYILRKQLEEADLIVLNKADQLHSAELQRLREQLLKDFPSTPQLAISALPGEGIREWLHLIQQQMPAGRSVAEVDYDIYAEGEAVLGWLNATASLSTKEPIDWGDWAVRILKLLQQDFAAKGAEIAHIKIHIVSRRNESLSANLTGLCGTTTVQGQIYGDSPLSLVLNARVQMPPEELHHAIQRHIEAACGGRFGLEISQIQSFSPARPQPLHRYAKPV